MWSRRPCELLTLCAENDFYPQFVQEHVSVSVSPTLRRGDTVALLEATDADLTATCHGDDCPCARPAFAIESGNAGGLFAVEDSTGHVTAASDLAAYDGQVFKLDVSVVNQVLDVAAGGDVSGPKNYGSLTIVIGQPGLQSQLGVEEQAEADSVHIRHKRVSASFVSACFCYC